MQHCLLNAMKSTAVQAQIKFIQHFVQQATLNRGGGCVDKT